MSDAPIDGLAALADRVERAKRTVPPPRHPRTTPGAPSEPAPTAANATPAATDDPSPKPPRRPARTAQQSPAGTATDEFLTNLADAPTVMIGARVRVPLDDLLTDLVHEARQHQVRTSKVELVEMALLSLVGVDGATIAERVREFRSQTGRYMIRR